MSDKRELALYWPESMLEEIQDQAVRTDRSLSYIVQFAWTHSQERISSLAREALYDILAPYRDSPKRKQTLFYPAEMVAAFEAEAGRLDSSMSLPVQAAVALAREAIAALPVNDALA